eukprot:GSMAST32.ASY1.ANO1.2278.1 assembled CDS
MHTWNWHVLGTDSTLKNEYDGPHPNDSVAVIGCGLSGLTAAKHLLLQGRKVVLIEKSGFCGGNSSKASSGINDSADLLFFDTLKSASRPEGSYTSKLIRKMADESKRAVEWIAKHANVSMPDVGQLGGHSVPRTHRPRTGLSGAAFISGLEKSIRGVSLTDLIPLFATTKSKNELDDTCSHDTFDNPNPTSCNNPNTNENSRLAVQSVILATGGFAADRAPGGLLEELLPKSGASPKLPTTNVPWATGDGIKIARKVGAATVDMEMVQIHPTGFSDHPSGFKDDGTRVLCAEILRGVGGILLNDDGERFTDELETRKTITSKMKQLHTSGKSKSGKFVIALPSEAWKQVDAHVHIYTGKQLLHWVDGFEGVTHFIQDRLNGTGKFVKKTSVHLPLSGKYLVGLVEPVLHYTMGGLKVHPMYVFFFFFFRIFFLYEIFYLKIFF